MGESNSFRLSRRRFVTGLGATAVLSAVPRVFAARSSQIPSPVLIIGDSMSLCGFGERLDRDFRNAGVAVVATFMACGTNPLSWTRLGNNAAAKTSCGLWTIKPSAAGHPETFMDVYGMSRGHRPGRYPVPKIEDLLAEYRPEILVVQLGNNLFDALKGRKEGREGDVLTPFIDPFLRIAAPAVRRIYWVAPPVSGFVPKQTQDALVSALKSHEGPAFRIIDSRELLTYPYHGLQPDKQHFEGRDMNLWADRTLDWIKTDLEHSPLPSLPSALPTPPPEEKKEEKAEVTLVVRAMLKSVATPYENREILPYHESMVALVYRVIHVIRGKFQGHQLVVLHPAHIGEKRQPMNRFFTGEISTLRLIPLEKTPWVTLKAKDDPRYVDLDRFITEEDHQKLSSQLK
jgi:hypothetical protein